MQLSWLLAPAAAIAAYTLSPLDSQAQSAPPSANAALSTGSFAAPGPQRAGCPFHHRAACGRHACCPGACCGGGGGGGADLAILRGVITFTAATTLAAAVTATVLAFHPPAMSLNETGTAYPSSSLFIDAAIGFYVVGGLSAIAAALLWSHPHGGHPQAYAPPAIAFGVSPNSMDLTLRF